MPTTDEPSMHLSRFRRGEAIPAAGQDLCRRSKWRGCRGKRRGEREVDGNLGVEERTYHVRMKISRVVGHVEGKEGKKQEGKRLTKTCFSGAKSWTVHCLVGVDRVLDSW